MERDSQYSPLSWNLDIGFCGCRVPVTASALEADASRLPDRTLTSFLNSHNISLARSFFSLYDRRRWQSRKTMGFK